MPLRTTSRVRARIAAQQRRDQQLAQRRAGAIRDYLVTLGVPRAQLTAIGVGSTVPLGTAAPTDPVNERVDFLKLEPAGTP